MMDSKKEYHHRLIIWKCDERIAFKMMHYGREKLHLNKVRVIYTRSSNEMYIDFTGTTEQRNKMFEEQMRLENRNGKRSSRNKGLDL